MNSDAVRKLFETRILPAFQIEYQAMENPAFFIDEDSQDIDGSGSPGLVGVTAGACNQDDFLVIFALAHETAHGVVYLEYRDQGRHCPNAAGYGRKKHEACADLIATRVLISQAPDLWAQVNANLDRMPSILGIATDSHPSGTRRVQMIKSFVAGYNRASVPSSPGFFSSLFCCFGKGSLSTHDAQQKAFDKVFKEIDKSINL